jgi:hypothetical protein
VVFAYCHFIALGCGICEWLPLIYILLGLRAPDAHPEHCENKGSGVHGSQRLSAAVGDKTTSPMHSGCQSIRRHPGEFRLGLTRTMRGIPPRVTDCHVPPYSAELTRTQQETGNQDSQNQQGGDHVEPIAFYYEEANRQGHP